MDPIAALAIIRDVGQHLGDRLETLANLIDWARVGGFTPAPDDEEYVSIIHLDRCLNAILLILDAV